MVKDHPGGTKNTRPRRTNARLAAVISESGLSREQVARAFVRVAIENGATDLAGIGRSHVTHWVGGSRPSGSAPVILCEALSRCLGRTVTLEEIGLTAAGDAAVPGTGWDTDTLTALADLGRHERDMTVNRREALGTATYQLAALTLPAAAWWTSLAERRLRRATPGSRTFGRGDVEAVREATAMFSRIDQRRGGGHARAAVVQYLTSDVAHYLRGTYRDDGVRRDMFAAASELAYLSGWMSFDNGNHAVAQRHFILAVQLAAEADDAPMAGHVLRAMAHQAIDLGHIHPGLRLAAASVEGKRYSEASPRERALLGVVHGKALAAAGDHKAAAVALIRAEVDLADATPAGSEPARVFFFSEASLAHETACALRYLGDLDGAARSFQRSVRTRRAATFTRTHAVTLGYLGAVQASQGAIEEACVTWNRAMDAMDGIRSARTRNVVADIRAVLATHRRRSVPAAITLETRASDFLRTTA
ncbi:hypothetical protein [Frankia sp. Cas4]|uniref:hypothetical protein n=1 Tax=Frankia sp. Cas4 TaxID=3073927 RepID=UPI002AD43D04|nr:hypothetical protein [Frankia sp. Cas4]